MAKRHGKDLSGVEYFEAITVIKCLEHSMRDMKKWDHEGQRHSTGIPHPAQIDEYAWIIGDCYKKLRSLTHPGDE